MKSQSSKRLEKSNPIDRKEEWIPFFSDGTLFINHQFQPRGYFLRKGIFVDTTKLYSKKLHAYSECKRRNTNNLELNLEDTNES